MMKMMMRLSKTQVPSIVKKTSPSSGNWDKSLHVMAGYKNFECMLVGAAGGYSGRCNSDSNNVAYEYGGGGGGSLKFSGTLASLPQLNPYVVGKAGAPGTDRGDNAFGGTGGHGEASSFGAMIAFGGSGGEGGKINRMSGGDVDWFRGTGGTGGLNSEGIGTAGTGKQGMADTRDKGEAGVWVSGAISGGGGGGGGPARLVAKDVNRFMAADGGYGASGDPDISSPGKEFGNYGGCGGGADIGTVTGVEAHYGGYRYNENGVVVLKMS